MGPGSEWRSRLSRYDLERSKTTSKIKSDCCMDTTWFCKCICELQDGPSFFHACLFLRNPRWITLHTG